MRKLSTLAVLAGLLTAFVSTGAQAQFIAGNFQPGGDASEPSEPDCSAVMGFMRGVKQAEIKAFKSGRVTLIKVCEDGVTNMRNAYGPLFRNGNAELLRLPIARNATLIGALSARDYDQHDVVSVRFGANDSVILYVHQRDMR